MKHYDYIFTGAGLSALLMVYKMVQSGKFDDKSILLIDENPKKSNDRTWCFWEKGKGKWDKITTQKWQYASFANADFRCKLDLLPYEYKMVRGIDFYNKIFKRFETAINVTFVNEKVIEYHESADGVVVQSTAGFFSCKKLFNSIYNPELARKQEKYPLIQQHFIGWLVKSETVVFDPNVPTFMDFSVEQKGNTRFMYVLPVSNTEALIEYTLFSKDLLSTEEYESEIKNYLKKQNIVNYEILEKEKGSIPMTAYKFWQNNTKNILNIGTSGGWTKASTGYTFRNSDKKSSQLIEFLQTESDFSKFHKKTKFWFYDLLLLDILSEKNEKGAAIFSSLFQKGNPALIFKFLDEETTFWEDLQVIWKCPKGLFIKALLGRLFP
ncbi:MAG: lycopene cyclase family protein [Flavobacterium sp.]|nr:lycopene cyclase family protein [Flavobacterium sp.]